MGSDYKIVTFRSNVSRPTSTIPTMTLYEKDHEEIEEFHDNNGEKLFHKKVPESVLVYKSSMSYTHQPLCLPSISNNVLTTLRELPLNDLGLYPTIFKDITTP